MPTITIRNVPPKVVRSLKALAKLHRRSMEQEVRELLEIHAGDRLAALVEIERLWQEQARRPSSDEVESWIRVGRP